MPCGWRKEVDCGWAAAGPDTVAAPRAIVAKIILATPAPPQRFRRSLSGRRFVISG
jgi:hypothetical protein